MRFRKHFFASLSSTQVLAREWSEQGKAQAGDIIVAAEQTGGYGRRGRAWQSPPGNVYMTLIEDFEGIEQLSWLGYAMGLGAYEALQPLLKEDTQLQLKWPNDLLLEGMKLSGMLLEIVGNKILVGIGINIDHAPETDQSVTFLNAYAKKTQKAELLIDSILAGYDRWHAVGQQKGFAGMREAWLEKAAFRGQSVTARLANGVVLQGVFHDLDPQGALALQTGDGPKRITAADIYLTGTQ